MAPSQGPGELEPQTQAPASLLPLRGVGGGDKDEEEDGGQRSPHSQGGAAGWHACPGPPPHPSLERWYRKKSLAASLMAFSGVTRVKFTAAPVGTVC